MAGKIIKLLMITLCLIILSYVFVIDNYFDNKDTSFIEQQSKYLFAETNIKERKNLETSIEVLKELNMENFMVTRQLAYAYYLNQDFKVASTYFQKTIDLSPKHILDTSFMETYADNFANLKEFDKSERIIIHHLKEHKNLDEINKKRLEEVQNLYMIKNGSENNE